ncbi:MAG: hypothetical protein MMC33_001133 [Icmadophila ericetorum]|nr:hypothetical protein [Icmadophila ericetorum]
MADQLLSQVQDLLEGTIDFQGQKQTELVTTLLLSFTGILALILGYIQADIHLTLWIGLLGTGIAFFVVVPPWPIFNESPETWLPDLKDSGSGIASGTRELAGVKLPAGGVQVDGRKVN